MLWCHLRVDPFPRPTSHQEFTELRQRRITTSAVTGLRCAHMRRIQFFHRFWQWQPTETVRIAMTSASFIVDLVFVPTWRCRDRNLLKFTKQRHSWFVLSRDHKATSVYLLVEFLQCKHYCSSLRIKLRIIYVCVECPSCKFNGTLSTISMMCESTAPSP